MTGIQSHSERETGRNCRSIYSDSLYIRWQVFKVTQRGKNCRWNPHKPLYTRLSGQGGFQTEKWGRSAGQSYVAPSIHGCHGRSTAKCVILQYYYLPKCYILITAGSPALWPWPMKLTFHLAFCWNPGMATLHPSTDNLLIKSMCQAGGHCVILLQSSTGLTHKEMCDLFWPHQLTRQGLAGQTCTL